MFDSIVEKDHYEEWDARSIVKTLLETLKHLHASGIAHRDLKPENIMLDENSGKLVILDFGFAGIEGPNGDETGLSSPGGTPGFKAPELFSTTHGKQVDVWSLGVITYILI